MAGHKAATFHLQHQVIYNSHTHTLCSKLQQSVCPELRCLQTAFPQHSLQRQGYPRIIDRSASSRLLKQSVPQEPSLGISAHNNTACTGASVSPLTCFHRSFSFEWGSSNSTHICPNRCTAGMNHIPDILEGRTDVAIKTGMWLKCYVGVSRMLLHQNSQCLNQIMRRWRIWLRWLPLIGLLHTRKLHAVLFSSDPRCRCLHDCDWRR